MNEKAVTLLELITVVIIIGILAGIAYPLYDKARESALDKEAIANLKLIQSAEKIYKLELGSYYASSVIADINQNLKLSLNTAASRPWDYQAIASGCAEATRKLTGGRFWALPILDIEPNNSSHCL